MRPKREYALYIKDLLVIGDSKLGKNGEYHSKINKNIHNHTVIMNNGFTDNTRADRIIKQIQSFGESAKANHKTNRLTRLVTDEFSFYTKNTPLSLDEYKKIINETSIALKTLPPNIVLIISSMPVLWPDGSLRNAVLHIQSPKNAQSEPIIHHFSKESFSKIDPLYSKDNQVPCTEKNCYEFRADNYNDPAYSPDVVLKDTKVQCNDKNQYKSAIIVEGVGIPPIIDTIDICLDHSNGVGMSNAEQLLKNVDNPPLRISHIVTSNYIKKSENSLTGSITHADWHEKTVENVEYKPHKNQDLNTTFGKESCVFNYGEHIVDIIHSHLFDVAIKNQDKSSIANSVDNNDNTLLHEVLLQNKKSTPQSTHRKKSLDNILQYFDQNTINKQNKQGNTPLHLAIATIPDENMLLRFIEQGARVNIKNQAGITPIDIAYSNNNTYLIAILCNKVINNKTSYLAHRETILDLVTAIKDKPMREKLARAALSKELFFASFDENTIIGLLKETGNPAYFIQNNLPKLVANVALQKKLYDYLITQNIFESANQQQINQLPENTKLQLLKQALSARPIIAERINLFLNELKVLQYPFSDLEYETLLTANAILPDDMAALSADEQKVVKAYITNDYQQIFKLSRTIVIDSLKIANIFPPNIAQHVDIWIKQTLIQVQLEQALIAEFTKDLADLGIIKNLLSANIDFDRPCGLNNGLTIREQTIAQAFINKDQIAPDQLQTILDTAGSQLTANSITKIANALHKPNVAATWIYQELIKNELKKQDSQQQYNKKIILEALSQGPEVWDTQYTQSQDSLTIAEQTIAQNYFSHDPGVIETVHAQYKTAGKTINVLKVSNAQMNVIEWLNQELIKIDANSLIIEKFQRGMHSNLNVIKAALLQKNLNLDADCGLHNSLTIREQAIAQAFIKKNTIDPDQLQTILDTAGSSLTNNNINNIIDSFTKEPNKKNGNGASPEAIKLWIYQERIKHELGKGVRSQQYNTEVIVDSLFHGHQVWDKIYDITQYNGPNGQFSLTIAEQAIVESYLSSNQKIFETVYLQLKSAGKTIDVSKISNCWYPNNNKMLLITQSINHEIAVIEAKQVIINEFKQGATANLSLIQTALSKKNLNLDVDCGLNNGLTIREQAIAQTFISRQNISSDQLQTIFEIAGAQLTASSITKIANYCSTANYCNTTDVAKTWIYQARIKHELGSQQQCNTEVIVDALFQGHQVWDEIYDITQYNDSNGKFSLTIAEQAIVESYLSRNQKIFETVYLQLKSAGKTIDVSKISNFWYPNNNKMLSITQSINHKIAVIEAKQVIIDEFKQGATANLSLIETALSKKNIDLDADCGLDNGLTIREQAIAQIFISNANTAQIINILTNIDAQSTIDATTIDKISRVFCVPPDDTSLKFKKFFSQSGDTIIQNEFKNVKANINDIHLALLLLDINLNADCGLNNGLTIGEQTLAQAFLDQIIIPPNQLQLILETAGSKLTASSISKIANSLSTPEIAKIWIYQQRIQHEFAKQDCQQQPDNNIILEALSQGPAVWKENYKKKYIDSNGNDFYLTIAEQAAVQAYLSQDTKLLEQVYSELDTVNENLNLQKISEICKNYPWSATADKWIEAENLKIAAKKIIIKEFQQGSNANLNMIQYLLSKNIYLKADCGLKNGLNICEQAIIQTFSSKDTITNDQLKSILNTAGSKLTASSITKIAAYCNPTDVAETWIYQRLIQNEFDKQQQSQPYNQDIILEALSQNKTVWDAPDSQQLFKGLTIAEAAVVSAYVAKDTKLLEKAHSQLKTAGKDIDFTKIKQYLSPQDPVNAVQWINQELIKIEFKHDMLASKKTILNALSHNINLNQDCEVNKVFTIKEQIIVQAYKLNDFSLLEIIAHLGAKINIKRIVMFAGTIVLRGGLDTAEQNCSNIKSWINQGLQKVITAEFTKTQNINFNAMIMILQSGSDASSGFNFNAPCGLNNDLSIIDQAIAQVFISKDIPLKESVELVLKKAVPQLTVDAIHNKIQKIAASFTDGHNFAQGSGATPDSVKTWIYQNLFPDVQQDVRDISKDLKAQLLQSKQDYAHNVHNNNNNSNQAH